jgi:hypothetical protein
MKQFIEEDRNKAVYPKNSDFSEWNSIGKHSAVQGIRQSVNSSLRRYW